jgi:hypothetical protein
MIRFAFLLLLLLTCAAARADDVGPSEKIPAGGVLRGNFVEDHSFTNGQKPLHSEGTFVVAPGRGIMWVVMKPIPLTFVFTAQGMAQSIAGLPLVQTKAKHLPIVAQISGLIASAMEGDWDNLNRVFVVSRNPTAKGWSANLKPIDAKNGLPFNDLTAEGSRFVDSAKALRPDGGLDTFAFSNQSVSATAPTEAEMAAFGALKAQNP